MEVAARPAALAENTNGRRRGRGTRSQSIPSGPGWCGRCCPGGYVCDSSGGARTAPMVGISVAGRWGQGPETLVGAGRGNDRIKQELEVFLG